MSAEPWTIEQCRLECRRTRSELESEQREHQTTAQELVQARYVVELQRSKLAQMERELAAAHQRGLLLAAELAECKRQGEAGGTRYATVTPLRPKPRPENDV